MTAFLMAVHFCFRIMSQSGSAYGTKSASEGDTPTKGRVHYFSHFPKAFLVPYGKPKEELYDESRLLDSLKPINCEWLTGPNVAASKLAETIDEQVRILGDTMQTVDLERVAEHFHVFANTIANFNTKNKKNKVTSDDTDGLVEALLSLDPEMEAMILQPEKMGQALYLMSTHHWVAQALITCYDCMAEQSQHKDGLDIHFKRDPSMYTLTVYLLTSVTGKQLSPASIPARRALLNKFQSMRRGERAEDRRRRGQTTRTPSPTRTDRRSLSPRRSSTSTATLMETRIPRRPRAPSPTETATTTAAPRVGRRRRGTPSPTGSDKHSLSPDEDRSQRPSTSRIRTPSERPSTSTTSPDTDPKKINGSV